MRDPTNPPPQEWMLPISEEPGEAVHDGPDAPAGPAVCPCGYALEGLIERDGRVRCPECGHVQRADGDGLPQHRDASYMVALILIPMIVSMLILPLSIVATVASIVLLSVWQAILGTVAASVSFAYATTGIAIMLRAPSIGQTPRRALRPLWMLVVILALAPHGPLLFFGGFIASGVLACFTAFGVGVVYLSGKLPE